MILNIKLKNRKMKTKSLFVMMMFALPSILVSCGKNEIDNGSFDFKVHDYRVENVMYPKGSKLKRVYQVFSNYRQLHNTYTYEISGKISRVDWDYESWKYYDIYLYNENGQLEKISKYEVYLDNSPNLRQTISYNYNQEGDKIKELIEWKDINSQMQTRYYLYQYNGKKLSKMETYENDKKQSYSIYEYKGDILMKEKFFVPNEKDYLTTEHFYDQNLLVYSITYNKNPKSGFMRDERKYYDQNDNLIKTVDNIPGLSSYSGATAFYVTWEYEYE